MGHCVEFATRIDATCDHPMTARADSCECTVCGARCTGKFSGCPAVWAHAGDGTSPRRHVPLAQTATSELPKVPTNGTHDREQAVKTPSHLEEALLAQARTALGTPLAVPEPRVTPQRRRSVAVLATGLLLAIPVGGVVVAVNRESGVSATGRTKPAVHRFQPEEVGGATVERTWRLAGRNDNELRAELEFTNPGATPLTLHYDEVVPKTLAASAARIRFQPQPLIIEDDPVVQWVLDLEPGDAMTVGYDIDVADSGLNENRLDQWVKDRLAAIAARVPATTSTTAAPTPPSPPAPRTTTTTRRPTTTRRSTPPPTEPPTTSPPTTEPPTTSPPTTVTTIPIP